jgi:hypothetical protein
MLWLNFCRFLCPTGKAEVGADYTSAMLVVEIIGERYLWVDSICIVQDDEDDLRENIHHMHYIYSEAALTIVVVGGDNADAVMAGLYPASRDIRPLEHVIELVHLVEIEPPLSLTLARST